MSAEVNPLHAGNFLRLKRNIPHLRGFHAFIVQHSNPAYRDKLIGLLHTGEDETTHAIWDLNTLGGFDAFEHALYQMDASKQRPKNLHIINFESLDEDKQKYFIKGFNYHRDLLADLAQTTLFFWLVDPDLRALRSNAPDFWAWREQVIDFSVPVEAPERNMYDGVALTQLDEGKKRQRIADISAYFARQPNNKPSLSHGDLYKEMGTLHEELGEYDKAKQAYNAAATIFQQFDDRHAELQIQRDLAKLTAMQGNPDSALQALKSIATTFEQLKDLRTLAAVQGDIASIYYHRGELDKALAIRQNEELPVFERLGDSRETAVTMGKIADIYYQRGEWDKALVIRQNEQLPVYERLGDSRAKAVTMGKIADIHYQRGEWDKALAIRQNEELPVYERLGDSRSKAITMGKIADIHYLRGEWDKALAIRQNEVLPIYEQLKDSHSTGYCLVKIAAILWQQNPEANADTVRDYLNQALAIFQSMKLPREIAIVEERLAEMALTHETK